MESIVTSDRLKQKQKKTFDWACVSLRSDLIGSGGIALKLTFPEEQHKPCDGYSLDEVWIDRFITRKIALIRIKTKTCTP